ncbi:fatty acid desaturase [Sphingobium sufflavum]|uniref:fatty acid desaturase family protein n=1 Tax=Sphingobium sufflavum TaxID=1129547 RepID=UPI001F32D152|nr:fatty acid desaturase [Sphingobium sufflavum]MCE7795023.1 fatty acid desaturase [Sphingobium sufflavum]
MGISEPIQTAANPPRRAAKRDDDAMLRAAVELTRDLGRPDPAIYWADMVGSAVLGYAALAGAILIAAPWAALACALVAVLALYRAGSFIHELTHIKHSDLPGFRFGWNALVGVPMLVPSFLYENVHTQHHARTRYGTAQDPEYLPLALMKPWTLPLFVLISALAPIGVLFRFAVLTPLGLVIPAVRAKNIASFSAMSINPAYRRRAPEGAFRRIWLAQEAACSLFAIALLAMVATGILPLRAFLIILAVQSGVMVLNQVRTLVAHLWENDGDAISVTEQYLDSVNVPPPGLLPELWAPVGLRYHALHHLLPSVPYHALPAAHRRLSTTLGPESSYHPANHGGLFPLVARLARSTMGVRPAAQVAEQPSA